MQWRGVFVQPMFTLRNPREIRAADARRHRPTTTTPGGGGYDRRDTAKDYYKILGIPRDATLRQVKAAYRKLAKRHHPDACPGDPEAAARFRDITDAYEHPVRSGTAPGLRPRSTRPHRAPAITAPGESPAASRLLAVLEDTWTAIRRNHPRGPAGRHHHRLRHRQQAAQMGPLRLRPLVRTATSSTPKS